MTPLRLRLLSFSMAVLCGAQLGCATNCTKASPPVASGGSATPTVDPRFHGLSFLMGEWTAEAPSEGSFSLSPEMGGLAIVRRNHAVFPGRDGKNEVHDDLVVIRLEGATLRADYLDDAGRTIPYVVTAKDGHAVFESAPDRPGPRFRVTYDLEAPDVVAVAFAIAAPGGDWVTHIRGRARRRPR